MNEQTISRDDLVTVSDVLDIAAGEYNLIYILDENCSLWIYDFQNSRMEQQYRNNYSLFTKNSKILVYDETLYIMDPSRDQKLVAVSLVNGQMLWSVSDIDGISFIPVNFSKDSQGQLFLLSLEVLASVDDKGETASDNSRLAVIVVGQSGKVRNILRNENLMLLQLENIMGLRQKWFIDVSPDGAVYILNSVLGEAIALTPSGNMQLQFETRGIKNPYGICIDETGSIFIGDSNAGQYSDQGDFTLFSFGMSGEETGIVSAYRGRRFSVVPDKRNRIFIYNDGEKSVTILKRQLVYDCFGISGLPKGVFVSTSFDCTDSETVWHKLMLDMELPRDTQVAVSYVASDYKDFTIGDEKRDIDLFLKSGDIPTDEKLLLLEPLWSKPVINPRDTLLFDAKGRYFWIKVEMLGNGRLSPLLKEIRVVYPRLSYLRYLPAVYQADDDSRDFLERFLSIFETLYSEMEDRISNVTRYLDADNVSGEFLKWLSQWLGIQVDESWDEGKLRMLVNRANEIYKKRGTRHGIEELIEIYTGEKPLIIEQFQLKCIDGSSEISDLYEKLYGDDPYRFYVLLRPDIIQSDAQRMAIKQILDSQKPAYTDAVLMLLQPWIYLDMYTYMGINTYLSEPTLLKLDNQARLPHNTIIIDTDNCTKLEAHSRLDTGVNMK